VQIRGLVVGTLIEAQLNAAGYEGAWRHRPVFRDAPWYELPLIVCFRLRLLSVHRQIGFQRFRLKRESAAYGLAHHPGQRNVRQIARRIASSDIAVHAGKPDLFHLGIVDAVRSIRIGPERGLKLPAALIDSDGVICVLHAGMERGIEEAVFLLVKHLEKQPRYTERANRVPNTDHADRRLLDIVLQFEGQLEGCPFLGVALAVCGKDTLCRFIVEILGRYAKERNHPAEAPHGVSAAAESEEIDRRAGSPGVGQESIALLNFLEEPLAHGTTGKVIDRGAVGANAAVIEGFLGFIAGERAEYLAHIRIVRGDVHPVRGVPRAVSAQNQFFRHPYSLPGYRTGIVGPYTTRGKL